MKVVLPTVEDVPSIVRLVEIFSQTGIVIKRTPEEIVKNINDFRVVKCGSKVRGCVSLYIYNKDLAELRTLIVDPKYQGRQIGSLLVEDIKEWVRKIKIKGLFTLTVKVDFFLKKGFQVIDKNLLPEKIFKDCQFCSYQNECRETALWMEDKNRL